MKSFAISSLFALVVGLIHYWVFTLVNYEFKPILLGLYIFMLALSSVFHFVLIKVESPQRFVNYYMGFSGGKLMLSLFILVIYGLVNAEYLRQFAISFLVVYFTFTAFEIVRLLRHLKN